VGEGLVEVEKVLVAVTVTVTTVTGFDVVVLLLPLFEL
jgi:hypothetical protein